jgi:hypothetical protein
MSLRIGSGMIRIGIGRPSISWSSYWTTRYISALSVVTTSDTTQTITATIVGTGFDGVSFEYSIDGGVSWSVKGTTVDGILLAIGLTAGTFYQWRARLYKGSNYSPYSNVSGQPTAAILLKDLFTGADDTLLTDHVMDIGAGWAAYNSGAWKILSNKTSDPTLGSTTGMVAQAGESDIDFTIDFTMPAEQNYIAGLFFRFKDATHFWRLLIERDAGDVSPDMTLLEFDGAGVSRGAATITHEDGVARSLRIVATDESVTIYFNGVQKIQYLSASALKTETKVGIVSFRDVDYKNVPLDNLLVKESIFSNAYDGIFVDSIQYAANLRNAYSKYDFTYSGTSIKVKVNPKYYGDQPTWSVIYVYVNGVYNQTVNFADTFYKTITLPAGASKTIRLIESYAAISGGDYFGTYITGIIADNTFVKIAPTTVSDKLVLMGDSILHGAFGTDPFIDGIPGKFYADSKNIAMYAGSSATLAMFASDAGKIATAVSQISSLFSNCIGTKRFILELGTNDATVGTTAATFKIQYGNLIDAIHAADTNISIFCLSPLLRGDAVEASHLVDYRTGIIDLLTTRAWATYINGLPILTYPGDYYDTIHPIDGGQTKIYNALTAVIYP